MGRTASPNPRNDSLKLPLTPAEKELIREEAAAQGLDMAAWVRDKLALPAAKRGRAARERRHRTPPADS